MKVLLIFFLLISSLFAKELTIAAASNVTYAIKPLIKEFNKKHPDIKVRFILGSSGKLTAQIRNQAPFDVFLSANMKYPNTLYKDGLAIEKPRVYAQGSLALFSYKKRDLKSLNIVNNVDKIAIANPKTAPYGKAAYEVLKKQNLLEKNKKKLVYAENISQTVQYAMTATDLGFIAKASLYSPRMKNFEESSNYMEIDNSLYSPIEQGIALLNEKNETIKFSNFIFSKEAKNVFKSFGYIVK